MYASLNNTKVKLIIIELVKQELIAYILSKDKMEIYKHT